MRTAAQGIELSGRELSADVSRAIAVRGQGHGLMMTVATDMCCTGFRLIMTNGAPADPSYEIW
jgi:hypothetical protein